MIIHMAILKNFQNYRKTTMIMILNLSKNTNKNLKNVLEKMQQR